MLLYMPTPAAAAPTLPPGCSWPVDASVLVLRSKPGGVKALATKWISELCKELEKGTASDERAFKRIDGLREVSQQQLQRAAMVLLRGTARRSWQA